MLRMPFSLKNAAQTFQHLIDTVCHGLDSPSCKSTAFWWLARMYRHQKSIFACTSSDFISTAWSLMSPRTSLVTAPLTSSASASPDQYHAITEQSECHHTSQATSNRQGLARICRHGQFLLKVYSSCSKDDVATLEGIDSRVVFRGGPGLVPS